MESSQKLYLAIKNAQMGNADKNVPHIHTQNAFLPDLFFMKECKAKNDPIAPPHLIALIVNGYLNIYLALRQSNRSVYYLSIVAILCGYILIEVSPLIQNISNLQFFTIFAYFNKRLSVEMGVPRFYKWLRNRYPQIRMDLTDANKQVPIIDNLYLDFNGIIYRCLSDYQCFLKNKFDPISIQEIYQRVYQYMLLIVQKVYPQKLIFIGFDGVAPRAKINQSRDRRFRAIKDRQKLNKLLEQLNIKDNQIFQVNSISPGTDFLTNLCNQLKKRVMGLYQTQWKHLKVFFSDCLTPGEGEHKIMDFLRHSKRLKLFEPTSTHCVYSADADVILLTISLNIQNICIIREDSTKNNFGFTAATNVRNYRSASFQYIFLNILREYFRKEFKQCLQQVKSNKIQPIINDFILLMAFVGNDFLPVQFCFVIKQAHMENLYRSYKEYLTRTKKFINNNGIIDWSGIEQLLEIAKKFQATMLDQKIKNKRNLINQRQMQKTSIMQPMNQSKQQDDDQKVEDDQVQNFEVVDNKIVKGKQLYYKTRFNIDDIHTDPKFKDIIIKYIQGLQFYNQYYFLGVPSWTWGYPYHYTPLLTDVYQYISNNKVNVKLNKGQPFDPFLALMFMLPEASFNILPKPLADTLRDPKCQLRTPVDYYPLDFKLDKYQSLSFHKRALIPFLKQQDVRKVYQSVQRSKYTDKQKEKNAKNNTIYFKKIGDVMSGAEIYFGNEQSEKAMVQFFRQAAKKQSKQTTKQRFPSLSIYGQFDLNQNGDIQLTRKYKYEGNPGQLAFYNNFIGFVQEMLPCPQDLKSHVSIAYRQIGFQASCVNLYKVKQARRLRQYGRFSLLKTTNEVKVPDFILMKLPKLEYIPEITNFEYKDIYSVGERVIVLNDKYFGYIGVIEKLEDKSATIKLTEPSYTTNHKIQQSKYLFKVDQQQFYSLESVADHLELDPQVVLALLDQILVLPKTTRKNQFDDIFPTAVNMGLNIINTQKGLLLPHYARCQMEYQNTQKTYQIFKKVELSKKCRQVLGKYIDQFQWVVDYIEQCVRQKNWSWRKGIPVRQMISLEADINVKLYQQFVKLYNFGVQGKFYSVYSKVANEELPQINPTQRSKQPNITLPYHEFISKKQAKISPPALKSQPQFHDIGDRVALLKTFQVGYVIGIDDYKVCVKLPKKSQPVCVPFLDAFNSKWGMYLMKEPGKCWDMQISYFSPQHYTKVKQSDQ